MKTTSQRFLSLDILRGTTIIFMIIVNHPGSWSHVYAPLLHAAWNGITPTDYIFPTFIFIMGTSIVLALSKRTEQQDKSAILKKVLWRSAKIYFVGLFLWLWPEFNVDRIRWVGVLQRISVVYLACALLYLYTSRKTQWIIGTSLLVGYLIVMCFVAVPGIGMPDLSIAEKNWAHYLDSILLPGVMWQKTWDPEGLLSTLPAIVTGMLGMHAGFILQTKTSMEQKLNKLFLFAAILLLLGDMTQYIFPLNKNLWSTSFTLLLGGISTIALGLCIYICDIKNYGHHFKIGRAFGVNAIFVYTLAGMFTLLFYSDALWGVALNRLFMDGLGSIGLPLKFLSLAYAVLYVFVIWVPTKILFDKNIYIKL